jgi:hypothetical protein
MRPPAEAGVGGEPEAGAAVLVISHRPAALPLAGRVIALPAGPR